MRETWSRAAIALPHACCGQGAHMYEAEAKLASEKVRAAHLMHE